MYHLGGWVYYRGENLYVNSDGRKLEELARLKKNSLCEQFGVFTNEELTEELETGVALGQGRMHVSVRFVQS